MADADKAEVAGAVGDDSLPQQPAEPPGEPRREPHPPEPEKQAPQHSSSSNGVKMYCLFLREPGAEGGGEAAGQPRGRAGARTGDPGPSAPRSVCGPSAVRGAGAAGTLPGLPGPPEPVEGSRGPAPRADHGTPPCSLT